MVKDETTQQESPKSEETKSESQPRFQEVTFSAEEIRFDEANKLIGNRVKWAMGVGLVPIPIVDLVGLLGLQISLVQSMAKMYDVPFKENVARSLISSLMGSIIPVFIAAPVSSLLKAIPVIGTATGAVSMSLIGGASTYAVGKIFLQHFESGGTLLDFDSKKMRGKFKEKFTEGKEVASEIKAAEEKEAKDKTEGK